MRRVVPLIAAMVVLALALPAPVRAARERRIGAVAAPVRLIPDSGAPIRIEGLQSYFGSIELSSAGDGLVVSNRLPLERYLLGLNEVPLDWPMESLRAQAVAARTYALYTLSRPVAGDAAVYGFDICASVQCQVFSGADVVATSDGDRWIDAVESTRAQAIVYGGAPILARYHSTSGGATLSNSQAFPGESDYPYLRAVSSTTEEGSPLYRWRVRFPLRGLEELLRRAGWWTDERGRLTSVRTIPSRAGLHYPDVAMRGRRGTLVRTAEELREVVRTLAPAMFPGRYPSAAPTSSGVLPETFPSNRIEIATRRKTVTVVGRGWGHGVGMSQWGAHGLARVGASYADILAHYYRGTTLDEFPDPGAIEVGIDWGRETVVATGSFRVVDGRGRTLARRALGTWRFRWGGQGIVEVDPPRGFGLPLRVAIVRAPKSIGIGEPAYITIALSRPARVRTRTAAPTGYDDPGARIQSAGRRRVVWLAPLEPGSYEIQVEASTGGARRRSEPVEVAVIEPAMAEAPPPEEEPSSSFPWLAVGGFVLLCLAAFGALAGTIRR